MGKQLIGTHNSATGEKPVGFLSKLLNFTAKCQDKTIKEQLEAGVRLFDLRMTDRQPITRTKAGLPSAYHYCLCGHGKCLYDITATEAITTINEYCQRNNTKAYIIATFEGNLTDDEREDFCEEIVARTHQYNFVELLQVAVKKPEWTLLLDNTKKCGVNYATDYFMYDKWYKYLLPVPKFWKRFQKYSETKKNVYSLRDFV